MDGWKPAATKIDRDRLDRIGSRLAGDDTLYRCIECMDIGYTLRSDDFGQEWATACSCDKGKLIRMGVSDSEAYGMREARRAQDRMNRHRREWLEKQAGDDIPF